LKGESTLRKYQIVLILSAILLLLSMTLSLFVWLESPKAEKTLISTDTLLVTQEGGRISVYDVVGDKLYTFRIKHNRSSEGRTKPITVSQDAENITVRIAKKYIHLYDNIAKKEYLLIIGRIFPKVTLCS
jgi:hypothetical protein